MTGERRILAPMNTTVNPLSSLTRLKAWCTSQALPYWAEFGFDRGSNAFHEKLDLDGVPILSAARRTFVQARQVFVFAQAAKLGWFPQGAQIAVDAVDSMIKRHWAPDGRPGWVFSVGPDGTTRDATRLAYTQAFALFSLASAYDLSNEPRFLTNAHQTIAFLDQHLSSPNSRGFLSSDIDSDRIRLQNPHMHLFEALLAWYEVSGNDYFLFRANDLFGLFNTCLFMHPAGLVLEYFDESWKPASGDAGRTLEPGHSLEWIWLLRKFSKLAGESVDSYVGALFENAFRFGIIDGLVINQLLDDGSIVDAGTRTWPQAEALKAFAVEHEAGRSGMLEASSMLAEKMQDQFIGGRFAAGWRDNLTRYGSLKIDFVPASTLYHVLLAVTEVDRVFLGHDEKGGK
jgi:mannose-6-phosphate isomerase